MKKMKKMKKSVFWVAVLLAGLLHGWALGADTWATPTEKELVGVWEGFEDIELPGAPEAFGLKTTIRFTVRLTYAPEQPVTMSMKTDMDTFLTDLLKLPLIQDIGYTKDTFWAEYSQRFIQSRGTTTVQIGEYYVLNELSVPIAQFLAGILSGSETVVINTNKTKLRFIMNEPLTLGLGDKGFKEIVLAKVKTKRLSPDKGHYE